LFVLSETNANFTVTGPGLNITGTATAQNPAIVAIPNSVQDYNLLTVAANGIHLTSDTEVSATFFYPGSFTETYLAIPTALLGTNYYAVTSVLYPDITIVGTQDNTKVTFTPTCTSFDNTITAGSTIVVSLNQGDTYQYLCAALATDDGTGSHVTSDKAVGVIAGNYFTFGTQSGAYGFISEMMFPVGSLYGVDFYSAPVSSLDSVRIIAAQDGTTVTVDDGASSTPYALNSGQFKEIQSGKPMHYSSNKPISVVQFGVGSSQSSFGNLISTQMVPTGAFRTSSRFYSPAGFELGNFATIIAPTASINSVTLNGAAVSGFAALPGGAYSYVTVAVPVGQSVITANQPVGVYATGFSVNGSYGNPTTF
jgi:hypothetical protein